MFVAIYTIVDTFTDRKEMDRSLPFPPDSDTLGQAHNGVDAPARGYR
jgi:hypothetical protein